MISLIVAMSKNRVIGQGGKIPWHISNDLKRFKALTMGHPIIMGRKTYESLGHALPGRTNIVLSQSPAFSAPGCATVKSLKEALDSAKNSEGGKDEVFIIGGESLYKQTLLSADKIYLTLVDIEVVGDPSPLGKDEGQVAFFPEFNKSEWKIISQEKHEGEGNDFPGYAYFIYERKK